jgi:hypothetical protein
MPPFNVKCGGVHGVASVRGGSVSILVAMYNRMGANSAAARAGKRRAGYGTGIAGIAGIADIVAGFRIADTIVADAIRQHGASGNSSHRRQTH